MKGVILAAGLGKRMIPLAERQPKPMIPIANTPIIEHILSALRKVNIKEVLVVTGFLAEEIERYFGDGEEFDMKIFYRRQRKVSGTAKAAELSREFVADEPFLLVYGDILTEEENYTKLIERYQKKPCATLMSLAYVDNPAIGGAVYVDRERVIKVVEKPKPDLVKTHFINAGIYVFEPLIFDMIKQTGKSERGEYELTTSIQKLIENNYQVNAVKLKGHWSNVSKPEEILKTNKLILQNKLHELEKIYIGSGTKVDRRAEIEMPVLIGKNCQIGNCFVSKYTCIDNNVIIGDKSKIIESAIFRDTQILDNSWISFATIGVSVRIGRDTILAGTPEKAAVVPDNSIIGA